MSIGYEGSDVNAPLGANAVALRDVCENILKYWSYVAKLGVTGLEAAPYNMSASDAQALYNAGNYMQTVAQVYFGTASQATNFNFDDALALVRGGQ